MLSKIAFVIGLMVGHALADGQALDYDITETTYFNQDVKPPIMTVEDQGYFNPESRVNFHDSQFYYGNFFLNLDFNDFKLALKSNVLYIEFKFFVYSR